LRYGRRPQTEAVLFAFDLLELGGKDLRRAPLEEGTAKAELQNRCSTTELTRQINELQNRGSSFVLIA
jgi:ATP-dependent DNA ligase